MFIKPLLIPKDSCRTFATGARQLVVQLAFETTLESIPAEIPYLAASQERIVYWKERLGEAQGTRIGVVWSGSTKRGDYDRSRSIALEALLPLLSLPGFQFVSLQKEVRSEDRAVLEDETGIVHFGEKLGDFSDTAALISLMDLIVSVDTAVAHLAGALGKPVWVVLPFSPDWRWMLHREDSPWYPTARLFRQPRIGDWNDVVRRVADELGSYDPGCGPFIQR